MPRIRGRFAPLTEELGSDKRFLVDCTDLEKLIYILIIYTCHMTHHQAPLDPVYYQRRFILRARKHQISAAIRAICKRFPKLSCGNGKLSLLNSPTYESQILPIRPIESEEEVEEESKIKSFEIFWNAYPRKKAKAAAEKVFKKIDIKNGMMDKILKAIEKQKHSDQWKKENGQFIPFPATWLNQRRWEDQEGVVLVNQERKPNQTCSACNGSGKLPDGKKCWCF